MHLRDAAWNIYVQQTATGTQEALTRLYDESSGLDAGPHDLTTPFIEELSGPRRGVVIPELLKGFLKKVGADGLQDLAERIAEPEALFGLQILFTLN